MKMTNYEKTISLRIDEKLLRDVREAIGSESLSGWLRKLITRELKTGASTRAPRSGHLVLV